MFECVKSMSQFSIIAFFLIFFISDVANFIKFYEKEINETLKLNFKKKETEKSIYKIRSNYRCHHHTQYEGTKYTKTVFEPNPFKRFRSTTFQFQVTFKVLAVAINGFTFNIVLKYRHNHPVNFSWDIEFSNHLR